MGRRRRDPDRERRLQIQSQLQFSPDTRRGRQDAVQRDTESYKLSQKTRENNGNLKLVRGEDGQLDQRFSGFAGQGLDTGIDKLERQKLVLTDTYQCLKSELDPDTIQKHYEEVKLRRDRTLVENEQLLIQISDLNRQKAAQSSWVNKCDLIQLEENSFKQENEKLKKHISRITKEYDWEMQKCFGQKLKVLQHEEMKTENEKLRQDLNKMQNKLARCRALEEKHRCTNLKDAKLLNKKLLKKKSDLEKELSKCAQSQEAVHVLTNETDELREKNFSLQQEIQEMTLKSQDKSLVKLRIKVLEDEKKALMRRNRHLKVKVAQLVRKRKYEQKVMKNQELLTNAMRQKNEQVQSIYEELIVETENNKVANEKCRTISIIEGREREITCTLLTCAGVSSAPLTLGKDKQEKAWTESEELGAMADWRQQQFQDRLNYLR
ncbi:hypothetical protein WMY93_011244 [Mugilogobius chulae]|uniref:Uncharacterized protein n=1 Tax=Mugilogobius chulae TaxID=88201 RepID=A0AAW0P830_9GOBI